MLGMENTSAIGHHDIEHALFHEQFSTDPADRDRATMEPAAERYLWRLRRIEPAVERALLEREEWALRNAKLRRLRRDVSAASRLLDMRRRRLEREITTHAETSSATR